MEKAAGRTPCPAAQPWGLRNTKAMLMPISNVLGRGVVDQLRPAWQCLLCAVLISVAPLAADGPRRIYLAADDHTDYLWSGDEEEYRHAFLTMLDYYLDLADATESEPSEFQSRFNVDGNFWFWEYERHKSAAEFQRLINRVRSGHISVPLNALFSCYGGVPTEAVLRGMYYAGALERQHGLRLELVSAIENQTHPFGLASLWAGAGAKYSWKGICNCATRVRNAARREHQMYWMAGPDGQRVLTKWYHWHNSQSLGGYAEARDPVRAIQKVENWRVFRRDYPYDVIGLFGQGWDDLQTTNDLLVRVARQQTNQVRQVIVSNEIDFFREFEARYGDALPTLGCSYGNEWDLLCTSLAEVSADVKRSVERLRGGESVASFVRAVRPRFWSTQEARARQTWMDLGLYWEHDWTANGKISRATRAAWQRQLARRIGNYSQLLQRRSLQALGALIDDGGESSRYFVFNPLGWARSDVAAIAWPEAEDVHVIDLVTRQEVPLQQVPGEDGNLLLWLASDVPPVGYRVYEVRVGAGKSDTDAARHSDGKLENEYYRLELAGNGSLASVWDKQTKREMVRRLDGRGVNDLGPAEGTVRLVEMGPVRATLEARSEGPLQHTTRVSLVRGDRGIRIQNVIQENFGDVRTWSFAFAVDQPVVRHEECGAIATARLLGDGGHYAAQRARYDWLTLGHFAQLAGESAVVTLSNADCYFMRLGRSRTQWLDTSTPAIYPLVGGQVDGPRLGIPNQGGDRLFTQRFAMRVDTAASVPTSMRFALEHQNPLLVGEVSGASPSKSAYPGDRWSSIEIGDPRLCLWALKPAEGRADRGLVVRIWNLSDDVVSTTLRCEFPFRQVWRTTHLETDLQPLETSGNSWQIQFGPQQLQTYRVVLQRSVPERAEHAP